MNVRSLIRNVFFTEAELDGISAWSAFIAPDKNLFGQSGQLWDPSDPSKFDLSWGNAGNKLGWIQGLRSSGNTLYVNHFSVDRSLTRFGLGTRLADVFGAAVKLHAGVSTIIFTEYTQSYAHDQFFTLRLGASKQQCHFDYKRSEWVWQVP